MPRHFTTTILVLEILVFLSTIICDYPVSTETYISEATNKFSLDLLKEIFTNANGNVISSPVSVSTLLAILLQAAEYATKNQLIDVLHANPNDLRDGYSKLINNIKNSKDNATLEFANGVFVSGNENLKADFKEIVKNDFLSEIYSLDFENKQKAASTINSWASQQTHGLIKQLFTPGQIPSDSKVILTNAIYFKSFWKTRFEKKWTTDEIFYTKNGGHVEVPTMYLKTDLISGQIEDLNARWLELPYEGHQYSFIIVIPKEVDDFDNLQKKFTAQHFSTILEELQSPHPWKIQVFMPKFKLESNLNNLVDILKKLGLTDIFTDVAQLQKITGTPVKINEIIQKAVIIVDENGSEAAAVTGGVLILAPAPPPRVETFRVDRPFLYFIIDKVNSIPLFAGRVTDPS